MLPERHDTNTALKNRYEYHKMIISERSFKGRKMRHEDRPPREFDDIAHAIDYYYQTLNEISSESSLDLEHKLELIDELIQLPIEDFKHELILKGVTSFNPKDERDKLIKLYVETLFLIEELEIYRAPTQEILSQLTADVPISLDRISDLVNAEKGLTEILLKQMIKSDPGIGEYFPLEQVFIKRSNRAR